jgi:hypothetical protein
MHGAAIQKIAISAEDFSVKISQYMNNNLGN